MTQKYINFSSEETFSSRRILTKIIPSLIKTIPVSQIHDFQNISKVIRENSFYIYSYIMDKKSDMARCGFKFSKIKISMSHYLIPYAIQLTLLILENIENVLMLDHYDDALSIISLVISAIGKHPNLSLEDLKLLQHWKIEYESLLAEGDKFLELSIVQQNGTEAIPCTWTLYIPLLRDIYHIRQGIYYTYCVYCNGIISERWLTQPIL
jgi:hypothetical protein